MKLVIIGGTGLIGSKLVTRLREHGHEAVPAAPNTGVNALTGEGVAEALQGASVVVDVSNSPSFADAAVMHFFTTSTATFSDTPQQPVWGITSRCQWWVAGGYPTVPTSERRTLRKH
jgi:uncharacterized protein YbjT (DUF2867 family)